MWYVAVMNRQYNKTQKLDRNKVFREFALRINTLEIGKALKNACDYLQQYMPIDHIGLYYLDEARRHAYVAAEIRGTEEEPVSTPSVPFIVIGPEHLALLEQDERDGIVKIQNARDPRNDFALRHFPWLTSSSVIRLRLSIEGELIGVLLISTLGFGKYRADHKRVLDLVKEPIAIALRNARHHQEILRLKNILADDYKALSMEMERFSGGQVVGSEFGLRQVMEMVRQVAPLTSPVLLLGETGTGKEVIANAIHLASPRREKPIIRVQCGALPDTLLDSELLDTKKVRSPALWT